MNHRESMEKDDMVKSRVGNTFVWRRTNEEDKRAVSPRDLKRRCQGLAEGWPWQPLKDPLHYNYTKVFTTFEHFTSFIL